MMLSKTAYIAMSGHRHLICEDDLDGPLGRVWKEGSVLECREIVASFAKASRARQEAKPAQPSMSALPSEHPNSRVVLPGCCRV